MRRINEIETLGSVCHTNVPTEVWGTDLCSQYSRHMDARSITYACRQVNLRTLTLTLHKLHFKKRLYFCANSEQVRYLEDKKWTVDPMNCSKLYLSLEIYCILREWTELTLQGEWKLNEGTAADCCHSSCLELAVVLSNPGCSWRFAVIQWRQWRQSKWISRQLVKRNTLLTTFLYSIKWHIKTVQVGFSL